ncbi:MAG TPA: ABC transporter ATP-binding protein [Acidimicrobiales bacterium]|nr:ABC transporter ATP-binding protein [Acidimicrobiales bacterium]
MAVVVQPRPGEPGGIAALGLHKSFGEVRAVRGVDMTIGSGETVALLGPNGAGKTTTIDMLLGLQRPDSGRISVFGLSPEGAVRAGLVGGMLQVGSLLRDLTVSELVTMVAALYPRSLNVGETLAAAGVSEISERRTQNLSGGQSQRVRFAIALVGNPDLLVLDEPTAALDVEGRRDFWASMRGVAASGKTVLFATHYLEEADAYADRVILMARGKVVADGSPTEIKGKVGARTIRATLEGAREMELSSLPGVSTAEAHGEAVILRCADSDTALRALLAKYPAARDIEVRGGTLEEAFIELTTEDEAPELGETPERAGLEAAR